MTFRKQVTDLVNKKCKYLMYCIEPHIEDWEKEYMKSDKQDPTSFILKKIRNIEAGGTKNYGSIDHTLIAYFESDL